MVLFLSLLFYVSVLIIGFHIIGQIFTFGKNIFVENLLNLIFKQIVGSIILLTIYTTTVTNFNTIYIIILPLLPFIIIFFWNFDDSKVKSLKLNYSNLVSLTILLLGSILLIYTMIRGDLQNGLKVPIKDQAFYSIISKGLSIRPIESFTNIIVGYNIKNQVNPYHYYEFWMSSILIRCFGLNAFFAQSGIIYGYSIFLIFVIVYGCLSDTTTKIIFKAIFILLALTFLFQRPWIKLFFISDVFLDSIFFDGHFKFVHIVPLFLFVLILIKKGHKKLATIFMLFLPTINSVTLPWLSLTFISILILFFLQSIKVMKTRINITYFLTIIGYVILNLLYLKIIHDNSSSTEIITSFGGIFFTIIINLFKWLITNCLLILIVFITFRKSINRNDWNSLIFLIIVFFSALFGRAILDTNQNSFQIFQSASYLIVYSMFLLSAINISSNPKIRKYLLILPIISFSLFLSDYDNISHVFQRNISKYDITYINRISRLKIDNCKGVKIANTSKLTNLMKNPIYAGLNEYFVFNDSLFCALVINTKDLLPLKSDTSFMSNCLRKEFESYCYFSKLSNSSLYESDSSKLSQSLFLFIKKYKPAYLIVDANCKIPIEFNEFLSESIIDKNSNEKFIILKY